MAVKVTVYGTADMRQIDRARASLDALEKKAMLSSGGFTGAMSRISQAASSTGSKMISAGKDMTRSLTLPLLAAGVAIGKFTQNAADDAKAQVILANALRNTTGATDAQVASVEKWITAQGKLLGVSDDELRPSLATLVGATKDISKAQTLAGVAMDIAAAKGVSVETASKALAKAYAGQTTAIARLVPGIDLAALRNKNFGEIVRNVAGIVGGQATSAAETQAGAMQRNKVAFDEAAESLGYAFIPIMQQLNTLITTQIVPAIQRLADWFGKLSTDQKNAIVITAGFLAVLGPLVTVLGATFKVVGSVAGGLSWMGRTTLTVIGQTQNFIRVLFQQQGAAFAADTAGGKLATTLRSVGSATASVTRSLFTQIAQGVRAAATWVAQTAALIAHKVASVALSVTTKAVAAAQWLLNAAMTANPIGIIIVAIGALIAVFMHLWNTNKGFRNFFISAWNGIKSFFSGIANWFSTIGKQMIDGFLGGIKDAWNNVTGWLGNAVDGLVSGVKDALGIHSPSRVFHGLGQNTADGFARGIKSGKDQVASAAAEVAKAASDAASSSYDKAESIRFANLKAKSKVVDPFAAFNTVLPPKADPAATKAKDIKDRAKELMGSFGIGEMVKSATVTPESLLAGIRSQADAMRNFVANVSKARKSGLAATAIAALLAAGPATMGDQAAAFAGMSASQIKDYNLATSQETTYAKLAAKMEKNADYKPNVTISPNAVNVTIQGNADGTVVEQAIAKALDKLVRELRSS